LARFKDGFFLGFFFALVLQLGIINITTSLQKLIATVLLLVGIVVSINQAIRRKSLISPPWDGFISGFGTLLGIISLVFPQLSILP
jgi:hypothetical protein